MLYMSSVRTVDSVNISCAYCDHPFYHRIPIWQGSHCVSSNLTVVLQADANDNQQNNVKYFNYTDVSYSWKHGLHMYILTIKADFVILHISIYCIYLQSHISVYICVLGFIDRCHIITEG